MYNQVICNAPKPTTIFKYVIIVGALISIALVVSPFITITACNEKSCISDNQKCQTVNDQQMPSKSNALTRPDPKPFEMPKNIVLSRGESNSNPALIFSSKWAHFDASNEWRLTNTTVCDTELPSPYLLYYNNIHWQQFFAHNSLIIYLLNSYYDRRGPFPTVKIIASTSNQNAAEELQLGCLFWFNNYKKPLLGRAVSIVAIWPKQWATSQPRSAGTYGTVIITCGVPVEAYKYVPRAVTLAQSGDHCPRQTPTNNLRVVFRRPAVKNKFAVCVKSLMFVDEDLSYRIVEWLEMLKILGAHKVFVYKYATHENVDKVLAYYRNEGFVDYKLLSLPGRQPNIPQLYQFYRQQRSFRFAPQELVELNDCLYRNLYSYEYLAILDIDEIIVPKHVDNWHELISQIQDSVANKEEIAAYAYYQISNTYVYNKLERDQLIAADGHIKSIPEYLHTMRHVYRQEFARRQSSSSSKCFQVVANVDTVYNNYPLRCVGGVGCVGLKVSPNESYVLHYRKYVDEPAACYLPDKRECTVRDTLMWKYFDQLDSAVTTAIDNIFN